MLSTSSRKLPVLDEKLYAVQTDTPSVNKRGGDCGSLIAFKKILGATVFILKWLYSKYQVVIPRTHDRKIWPAKDR